MGSSPAGFYTLTIYVVISHHNCLSLDVVVGPFSAVGVNCSCIFLVCGWVKQTDDLIYVTWCKEGS